MTDTPGLRKALYGFVQDYPGLHVRELSRRLGTPVRLVEYHAAVLLEQGMLEEHRTGAYQRLFPNHRDLPLTSWERDVLGELRKPVPLAIVLALLDAPDGLSHGQLCQRTQASKANLSHHLKALQRTGVVDHDAKYRLADARALKRLLRQHKPLPDLRTRFADQWAGIYGIK